MLAKGAVAAAVAGKGAGKTVAGARGVKGAAVGAAQEVYNPNEPLYCICRQVGYGDMVSCGTSSIGCVISYDFYSSASSDGSGCRGCRRRVPVISGGEVCTSYTICFWLITPFPLMSTQPVPLIRRR